MVSVEADTSWTKARLEEVAAGNRGAIDKLVERFQPRLMAFVECRVTPDVRARFSGSDVVQEAQIEVVRRMDEFLKKRPMPFHLWVRKIAYQRLLNLHRDHRHRAKRSVEREIVLPMASSAAMANPLIGKDPSPCSILAAREVADRVGNAVATLAEQDREILLMRHVEDLPYEEISCLLDIEPAAARKRYGRAMIRLQRILSEFGLLE